VAEYVPFQADRYIEPFAGKGNSLFYMAATKQFTAVLANDRHQVRFWESVTQCEVSDAVLDCFATFGGKGGKRCEQSISSAEIVSRVNTAWALIRDKNIEVSFLDWRQAVAGVGDGDFVYLDPPYLGKTAPYPNIDHNELIEWCKSAKCNWLLSGYLSDDYLNGLGEPIARKEIQMSLTGGRERRTECLWSNVVG
jgi:site-specific DNA-adenine methylase